MVVKLELNEEEQVVLKRLIGSLTIGWIKAMDINPSDMKALAEIYARLG